MISSNLSFSMNINFLLHCTLGKFSLENVVSFFDCVYVLRVQQCGRTVKHTLLAFNN